MKKIWIKETLWLPLSGTVTPAERMTREWEKLAVAADIIFSVNRTAGVLARKLGIIAGAANLPDTKQ